MEKVLITTSSFDLGIPEIKAIRDAGYEIVLNPHGRKLTELEVADLLTPDIVGLIAGVEPLTKKVILGAKNLRVISRCGIGMDTVDVEAAKARNIEVFNTPDAPTKAVAELTVGLMLDALRGITAQDRSVRAAGWERPMGGLLGACTVGLIGYGRIGRKVAEYVKGFGAKIVMHDVCAKDDPLFLPFDRLLAQADIVSLHIPFTAENSRLIDADVLGRMKKGAILINTSRGGLIDEAALAKALESGHLAAAALDVFEQEPYKGPLTGVKNVILTAHTGSYAKEARIEQEALAARNVLAGLGGKAKAGERTYG